MQYFYLDDGTRTRTEMYKQGEFVESRSSYNRHSRDTGEGVTPSRLIQSDYFYIAE